MWFVGTTAGVTSSTLRFDDEQDLDFDQRALTLSFGRSMPSGWTFTGSLGSVFGGELAVTDSERTFDMGTGLVVAASASRRWTFGTSESWFVIGSGAAGFATTSTAEAGVMTEDVQFSAVDVRFGAIAGRTLFDAWSPYVLSRVFGGPVLWSLDDTDITGSDRHHYQLGVGSSVTTPFGLSVVIDVAVLGERSASLGATWQL
ncbi:MAG: hypothetical protein AAGC55_09990 [Myxococcota bacterium]